MPRTHASEFAAKVLGTEVRRARVQAGLNQVELAARLGVSRSYVSNLEAGRVNVTVGQLANIADALKVGLEIRLPEVARERVRLRPRRGRPVSAPILLRIRP
jgi:transcriptional regulator with XRE-family HTH domain